MILGARRSTCWIFGAYTGRHPSGPRTCTPACKGVGRMGRRNAVGPDRELAVCRGELQQIER